MKEQKKIKEQVKKAPQITFTISDELDQYSGAEFTPPKLKEAEKKFDKQAVHH